MVFRVWKKNMKYLTEMTCGLWYSSLGNSAYTVFTHVIIWLKPWMQAPCKQSKTTKIDQNKEPYLVCSDFISDTSNNSLKYNVDNVSEVSAGRELDKIFLKISNPGSTKSEQPIMTCMYICIWTNPGLDTILLTGRNQPLKSDPVQTSDIYLQNYFPCLDNCCYCQFRNTVATCI